MSAQNYTYPDSRTLKNKYGIKNLKKFEKKCAHDSARAAVNLLRESAPERFDVNYLQHIHKSLFNSTFEWAGQTREKSFQFSDGSVASMPGMQKVNVRIPFAIDGEIRKTLDEVDKNILANNYFKGSSREEFVDQMANVLTKLNHAHPFREGNGRTQRIFCTKLAEASGHTLDFSLVTKFRMDYASIMAAKGEPGVMKYMLDDISNPEKMAMLKDFFNDASGIKELKRRLVMTAYPEKTYHGTYLGGSNGSFAIETQGIYIVAHKSNLPPEQLRNLKVGDFISYTEPAAKSLEEKRRLEKELSPHERNEFAAKIETDPLAKEIIKEIQKLSKAVYGKLDILGDKLEEIKENPSLGEELSWKVAEKPQFINKLAGRKILGVIKSDLRKQAEDNIIPLCHALEKYSGYMGKVKVGIIQNRQMKRSHRGIGVDLSTKQTQSPPAKVRRYDKEFLSSEMRLKEQINKELQSQKMRAMGRNHSEGVSRDVKKIHHHARQNKAQSPKAVAMFR
ncbi:BID domain-containing T4SS effector [Bartonella ancashensis]|uniref:protein adenylyltransferase n=1 Tax=Bartonella ancashensis TaxID=1318743 RepID=A0A0M5KUB1_9HYPH|nr:BID domain-containing T4SS effector [Bartonella ancashensis]ALE03048.1 hypothetical protein PU02_0234 [Bartonella ancashensis]ARE31045.1 Bep234 [Bartonella ancashensis]